MNVQNWGGWHWIMVGLTGLLAAEHATVVASALGALDGPAIAVTTTLLALVGVFSPSAAVKK